MDPFELGFFLGVLAGEGHFGGDGRQPQITLRMHTRHAKLFEWLRARFPESRLYGPYHHGGRDYFQWMARGRFLREQIWPLIRERLDFFDEHVRDRATQMATRYQLPL
jgi:hypothetical protein